MGVETLTVDLPLGTMHLMGMLRFLDRDLALVWPGRLAYAAVERLRKSGFRVLLIPDTREAMQTMALNFVTLKPRSILMAAGNPATQAMLEAEGVTCHTVAVDELVKAAGGIGCLTGILHREEAA
jgi:N-dimethylarginine dimethylaminohydrolase